MTQEEIKKFNYRAFLLLVRSNQDLTEQVKKTGYNPEDIFLGDLSSPFLQLNGQFKQALLKVYRANFEEQENLKLKEEFDKLCKENRLLDKRNYMQEVREIEEDIIRDIKQELKRLNRSFTRYEDEPIEFMTWDSTSDVDEIHADGTVLYDNVKTHISDLINNNTINIYDAIGLHEQLALLDS